MIHFLIRNYKAVCAFLTLLIASILTPGIIFIFNFFVDTRNAQATVKIHETRITSLTESTARVDEKFKFIKESLEKIERREYQELRSARQQRQAEKQ